MKDSLSVFIHVHWCLLLLLGSEAGFVPTTWGWTGESSTRTNLLGDADGKILSRREWIQQQQRGLVMNGLVAASIFSVTSEASSADPLPPPLLDATSLAAHPGGQKSSYKLVTGVQFKDIRIGQGHFVTEIADEASDASSSSPQLRPTVVLHVQALLQDGSILMDTRQDGKPILYELGSSLDYVSSSSRSIIPPGLDDAIVSRGTTENTSNAKQKADPMRQGGIRRVVVPAELAYGYDGLSRYQAMKLGGKTLRKPVPRDEVIRYEVEVLRCIDVPADSGSSPPAQACCTEEVYPCAGIGRESNDA